MEGRHFRSVHLELDELVDSWRLLSDDVAERVVTIGASPDGQAETIAGATEFDPLPAGHLGDLQVLGAIGDRLTEASIRTRGRIERVAVDDPITCDLLVRVAGTLEKQLWMIQAQRADAAAAAGNGIAGRAEDGNEAKRS